VVKTAGLLPWLIVVTRNAAIGIVRSEAWRTRREERAKRILTEQTVSDPADVVLRQREASGLHRALHALPREQKTAVELAYFHFLTMAQIAEQTATPIGTVKRRVQIALRQLGKLLREVAP
jgi:RNA polymerase sigma factor (sigma-70 family)